MFDASLKSVKIKKEVYDKENSRKGAKFNRDHYCFSCCWPDKRWFVLLSFKTNPGSA